LGQLEVSLGLAISVLALAVSIATFVITSRRARVRERVASYLAIERDANTQIYLPLLQYDYLNRLFHEHPSKRPPAIGTPEQNLTREDQAILNFASMLLDYFEQMFLLENLKLVPDGILSTWRPWIDDCARSPYFRWAWEESRHHYLPDLVQVIDQAITDATNAA